MEALRFRYSASFPTEQGQGNKSTKATKQAYKTKLAEPRRKNVTRGSVFFPHLCTFFLSFFLRPNGAIAFAAAMTQPIITCVGSDACVRGGFGGAKPSFTPEALRPQVFSKCELPFWTRPAARARPIRSQEETQKRTWGQIIMSFVRSENRYDAGGYTYPEGCRNKQALACLCSATKEHRHVHLKNRCNLGTYRYHEGCRTERVYSL